MKKTWLLISIIVVVCAALFMLICLFTGIVNEKWTKMGTLLSAVMAVSALIVSIFTLISIDSVDAVSRMDGNILENTGYRTSLYSLLNSIQGQYKPGSNGFSDEDLLSIIEAPYKKNTLSGTQLADNLQNTIDYLVFLPFLRSGQSVDKESKTKSDIALGERISSTLNTIEKRVSRFERINAGSSILIRESYSLIQAVIGVQFKGAIKQSVIVPPGVRGTMLKNPVSAVVYNDYCGLYYLNKAESLLLENNKISLETIKGISSFTYGNLENCERVLSLFELANKHFKIAVEAIGDDVMWNAFIWYNVARTNFYINRLQGKVITSLSDFDEAIKWRCRVNDLIEDVFDNSTRNKEVITFFKDAFIAQELKARLYKELCAYVIHPVAIDLEDILFYRVKEAIQSKKDFGRLETYYNELVRVSEQKV